ncbi:MAG: helix-turn-helix transcriptional regulator [Cyanobacteria bacterium CRU_2_1]|nr:helix-turn-helix transcriptional regulator [Cyanobacteria bacterium CRU_2_1]
MPEEKPLILDCAQEDLVLQVALHSSLLSSREAQWNGVRFEFHRQPPAETPEHCPPQHVVTIPIQHYSTRKPTIQAYEGGLPQNKLRTAIDYIQAHLAEDISLEAMADHLGISRYHFCRMFKQSTGLSPHQYLIQCRVERAKQLLRQGKMKISEVAIACGFTHQSHLHRHFKRLADVIPLSLAIRQ